MLSTDNPYGIPHDSLVAVRWTCTASCILAWCTVLPRIYIRAWLVRNFGWDDGFMMLTMLFFTIGIACFFKLTYAIADIYESATLAHVAQAVLWYQRLLPFYTLCFMFFKAALMLYFIRLGTSRWHRVIMISAVSVYWALCVPYLALVTTQCGSFQDTTVILTTYAQRRCRPWSILAPLHYTFAIFNCLTDWLFIFIPMILVWHSQMAPKKKMTISALIGLGLAGSICSIVRLPFISGLRPDIYILPHVAIILTSCVEIGLGIAASNLATLKPLWTLFHSAALAAKKSTIGTAEDEKKFDISVQVVHNVGILSRFAPKTALSTVSSGIFRRIRQEDFAMYATKNDHTVGQWTVDEELLEDEVVQPQVAVPEPTHQMSERLSMRSFEMHH